MKHTPTPWRTCSDIPDQIISAPEYDDARANGRDDNDACGEAMICETGGNQGNAEFIVRACNAHYEMFAMLKKVEQMFSNFAGNDPGACLTAHSEEAEACEMADEIREILEKVEGEE